MSVPALLLLLAVILVAAKTGAWLWQRRTRNAGMVDAVWALTLAALAAVCALAGDAPGPVRALVGVMGVLWGLRLGLHLWVRNAGKPEDWRYASLRARWGVQADRNMFWFFQFQNLFSFGLAASAFVPAVYRADAPAAPAIAAAVLLWVASLAGEALADRQMERFRADPSNRGRVCRSGLWRYSRHPNYFFECVQWAAYVPLALGAPWGWLSLIAPVLMAGLLLKLSGVPMMEAEMVKRKPEYAEYIRTTSVLVPWKVRD